MWATMLTLQIGNPSNMGVLSCLGHRGLCVLSALVLFKRIQQSVSSTVSCKNYENGNQPNFFECKVRQFYKCSHLFFLINANRRTSCSDEDSYCLQRKMSS